MKTLNDIQTKGIWKRSGSVGLFRALVKTMKCLGDQEATSQFICSVMVTAQPDTWWGEAGSCCCQKSAPPQTTAPLTSANKR